MATENTNKIAAVIVCYNPLIERLQQNIKAICNQVSHIFIIDNNSSNINEYEKVLEDKIISIIKLEKNRGLAYALNEGLKNCKSANFKWMITLDQDSVFDSYSVDLLFSSVKDELTAIVAPRVIDLKACNKDINKGLTVITSGCLTNIDIVLKSGGYINKMFIDYIDHELCLRLISMGYSIIKNYDAILHHEIGSITRHKLLFLSCGTLNHHPDRHYFLFRNKIYVYKKYIKIFPKWVLNDIRQSVKSLFLILIFEKEKKKNLKLIILGIKDGLFSNFNRKVI